MDPTLPDVVRHWANDLLVWVGFGTVVGLLAKAIMPGRDQGGALATLLMGVGGPVVGCGTLMYFWEGKRVTPLSLLGFLAATVGAFALLFFHRLLNGAFFREEGTGLPRRTWLPRPRRRAAQPARD
jgi:uncharacterized membrane protein YeaQ/YmgE (transglycosylase-associated protein family)